MLNESELSPDVRTVLGAILNAEQLGEGAMPTVPCGAPKWCRPLTSVDYPAGCVLWSVDLEGASPQDVIFNYRAMRHHPDDAVLAALKESGLSPARARQARNRAVQFGLLTIPLGWTEQFKCGDRTDATARYEYVRLTDEGRRLAGELRPAPTAPKQWRPKPGYVGTKAIGLDAKYQKSGKNPVPSTIGDWVRRSKREGKPVETDRDPASHEVYYPEGWVIEQVDRWSPRTVTAHRKP